MSNFPVNPNYQPAPAAPPPPPAPARAAQHAPRFPNRQSQRTPSRDALHVVGRDGEVLTRSNRTLERQDQFDLPPAMRAYLQSIDYTAQWQPISCYNMELPQGLNIMVENGWRAVEAHHCDGYYHPKGHAGPIIRDGQMLMIRPRALTEQAVDDGIRTAKGEQLKQYLSFKGETDIVDKVNEQFGVETGVELYDGTNDTHGFTKPIMKKGVQGSPTSLYPQRQRLTVGEED